MVFIIRSTAWKISGVIALGWSKGKCSLKSTQLLLIRMIQRHAWLRQTYWRWFRFRPSFSFLAVKFYSLHIWSCSQTLCPVSSWVTPIGSKSSTLCTLYRRRLQTCWVKRGLTIFSPCLTMSTSMKLTKFQFSSFCKPCKVTTNLYLLTCLSSGSFLENMVRSVISHRVPSSTFQSLWARSQ